MSAITAKEQAVRNALDRGEALVAVDHDGVMAPIVANPLLARPLPAVNTAIAALASRTPVLLPSGRSVPFLRDRVPVPGVLYSGLYGRQWTTPDGRLASHPDAKKVRRSLAQARAESGRELRREGLLGNGVWIEDKEGLAFAVHFRPLIARIDQLRRLGPAADADRLYDLTVLLDTVTRRVPLILKQIGASHGLLVTSSNKVSEMSGPGFDKQRAVLEGQHSTLSTCSSSGGSTCCAWPWAAMTCYPSCATEPTSSCETRSRWPAISPNWAAFPLRGCISERLAPSSRPDAKKPPACRGLLLSTHFLQTRMTWQSARRVKVALPA
jgi:trehalose-6-phosphatase